MNNFETDYNDPDYCDEGTPGICFDMRALRAELRAAEACVAELERERDRLNRIAGIAARISTYRTPGDATGARVPLRLLEALDRAIAQAAKKGGAT